MVGILIRIRKSLFALQARLVTALKRRNAVSYPLPIQSGMLWVVVWFIRAIILVIEIPFHLTKYPAESFAILARRGPNYEYLESYASHIRRYQIAIATTLSLVIVATAQLYFIGQSYMPKNVQAVSTNVTINPSWDDETNFSQKYVDDGGGGCLADISTYSCAAAGNTTMQLGMNDAVEQNAGDCSVARFNKDYYNAMKFSLSTVPPNATVTKVELIVNVSTAVNTTVRFRHITGDAPDTLSCTASNGLWGTIDAAANYATSITWGSTGSKTVDLGATAVSDVQARIGSNFGLGIQAGNTTNFTPGVITSVDNSTNKPQLRVTYTTPPQTPTGMGHSAISTSSISWSWTDNATQETRYDVHDASHANVTGCTNLPANSNSCTETGLSANTQYTRHPNVTDPQGNTDGSSTSAYTAIEASSGITFGTVTSSSIDVSSTSTPSNLSSGSSGIWFQESVSASNSGWLTANSWTKSSLSANTQYSFQAKTRNGDSVETSLTSASTKYTLSAVPSLTPGRSTSTWYSTDGFSFTNAAGWGSGGVQYYRYVWDQNPTYAFSGSENTWSNLNANCPGGTCTTANTTLSLNAVTDGNTWYLHVQAYNAADVANGSTNSGPFYYDHTAPTTSATVNDGTGADATYTTSLTQLSANWTTSTDTTSGVQGYQYAIGTSAGGTDVVNWTDNAGISVTKTGLTLSNGTTYYFTVRAIDNAGNTGSVTNSNGITVNTSLPMITDNQSGDTTPRNTAGTLYDIDFAKATTGPQLDYAQYTVFSAPAKAGTEIQTWTNIFTGPVASFTTNWSVAFTNLLEGTNYVSVKVVALDGLSSELDDAFTILKDTTGPSISSFVAAPSTTSATLSWTTNEAATTQLDYGTTTSYGSTTTLDPTRATSHSVSLSGLASNTTFHARAHSSDQAGNETLSSDLSFTTSAGTHTLITNVAVTIVNDTTVTVTWTTNEPATSKVRYGTSTDYGSEVNDTSLVTAHSVTLTGLSPKTEYHYEVLSTGTTTDNDADATFTTAATPTTTPTPPPPSPTAAIPAKPVITSIQSGQELTQRQPIVAGTSDANAIIFVVVDGSIVGVATAGDTGTFRMTLPDPLTLGTHLIVARARNSAMVVGPSSEDLTFTIVTPSVTPTVRTTTISDGTRPSIQYDLVVPPRSTVKVMVDGQIVVSYAPPRGGTAYGLAINFTPPSTLAAGQHTVYLVSYDSRGHPSAVVGTVRFTTVASSASGSALHLRQSLTYTVKAGDSLWSIASSLLGDGHRWTEIRQANLAQHPSLLLQPSVINTGWVLVIRVSAP